MFGWLAGWVVLDLLFFIENSISTTIDVINIFCVHRLPSPPLVGSPQFGQYCDIDAANGRAVISDPTNNFAAVFSTVTMNELVSVSEPYPVISVSIQGNRLATGVLRVPHNGRVTRYTVDYTTNTVSTGLTYIRTSDERYGGSIKICGDVVAVGAILEGPDNQGRIFALDFDTNTNTLLAEHPDNVYATNDYMGQRVDWYDGVAR